MSGPYLFLSKLVRRVKLDWWRMTVPMRVKALGVRLVGRVQFFGMPIVSMVPGSEIEVDARVVLCSDPEMTALGVSRPVILRTLSQQARIKIGEDSGLSGTTICAARSISIGKECLIGADVLICDTDFHALAPNGRRFNDLSQAIKAAPVTIEDNVFIGARSIVLKGVSIGHNSVIGAGSVVVSDIPANVIAAGSPAKVIRAL